MQAFDYLKEVRAELIHVKWPTRKTALNITIIVVILSIITALYLGAFDFLFAETIKSLI